MFRKDPFVTGEYYHIYNRGIDKRIIFKSKFDFERFMMLLVVTNSENSVRLDNLINHQHKKYEDIMVLEKSNPLVSIGAWCLMSNHFHMIIRQEVDGGITQLMKKLGTGYSMYFNIKYDRRGALFGGPFKSKLVGVDDSYLYHLFGYIHLNPLEIKFPDWEKTLDAHIQEKKYFLESYRYSSYLEYMGKKRAENTIVFPEAFPDYFSEKHAMGDFIENYLRT